MDTHFDTLAAWADGEPADRAAVLRALETADGRDYVVDLMALRRMVAVTTPPAHAHEARPAALQPRRWFVPVTAAAVLCVAAGYVAGRTAVPASPAPPAASRPAAVSAPAPAPAPTHVIRLKAGIDWRETTGGN
jgi:hypothetical protein